MARAGRFAGLCALALAAGCATRPSPQPARPPVQPLPPQPSPVPAPAPEPPAAQDWQDVPLTPGDWRYDADAASSQARFGASAGFVIRCDRSARRLTLVREGADPAGQVTIRTSTGARGFAAPASVQASDPFLDAIAFSRGRFTVEVPGHETLFIPAWPEPARVIEDCRS